VHGAVRIASFQLLYRPLIAALPREALRARLTRHPDPQRAQAFMEAAGGQPDASALAGALERFGRIVRRVDAALQPGAWLVGDAFSLADVAMAPFAERLEHLGLDNLWDGYSVAQDWVRRILARASVLAARAPQEHRFPLAGAAAERTGR